MNKFFRYFRETTALFTILSVLILISWIAGTSTAADRDKEYVAKQITNFKVDGNIREWDRAEAVPFDQLKDAGNQIPDPDDFTGSGRVAWNANDPTRIYFLVEITDDTLQDIHPANSMWWVDDSVEFMFDFDNDVTRAALVQWTLGANGKDLSAAGSSSNTEWIVVKNGNDYIYEVALDPTKQRGPNPGNDNKGKDFRAKDGLTVGFSFHMNDCENGGREHQIGWIAGQAWDPLSFGDLTFDKEFLDVEPSGKIALTWAAIKR